RFSDEEAAGALQRLLTLTNDYDRALSALGPVLDLAASRHISAEEAAQLFGLAIQGSTRGLRQLGVILKGQQLELFDTADATQRLAIVTDLVGKKMAGAAANDAKTLSGQLALLRNQWDELKEAVGGVEALLLKNSVSAQTGAATIGDLAVVIKGATAG